MHARGEISRGHFRLCTLCSLFVREAARAISSRLLAVALEHTMTFDTHPSHPCLVILPRTMSSTL